MTSDREADPLVPDDVIPHGRLPPLHYRDLPEPPHWRKLVGPSIMLAGLALGSGEYVFWPYVVYKSGFIFIWACLLGVVTQFFVNLEITRWTLATGESAITGFCRLSRHWAGVMLALNILPWMWPAWATGAAQLLSWLCCDPVVTTTAEGTVALQTPHVTVIAIASLWAVGAALTLGPVVYKTVERAQLWLVGGIFVAACIIGALVIRPDAVQAFAAGAVGIGGMPPASAGITQMELLGALAFAGAGGTMNLGQSNFIKEKGYGMGKYIGRITSPLTGQEETVHEIGYHFPLTAANLACWKRWWRAANIEHFFSFLLTCLACLVLLTLISYSLFYDRDGGRIAEAQQYGKGFNFIWGEAELLRVKLGGAVRGLFLLMGVGLLVTTELGILDATARISTDIVKVNFLRHNDAWSASRLYFCFLWGEILLGTAILWGGEFKEPGFLLRTSAAMNGGVMFLYSLILLYLNAKILPRPIAISPVRFVALVWSCAFFGYFTLQALQIEVVPLVGETVRQWLRTGR